MLLLHTPLPPPPSPHPSGLLPHVLAQLSAIARLALSLRGSRLAPLQVGRYFALTERRSKFSTELRAGTVTFLTVR